MPTTSQSTDYVNADDPQVTVVNSDVDAQASTAWNDVVSDLVAGYCLKTSLNSEPNARKLSLPDTKGNYVTDIVRYSYGADVRFDDPIETYKLTPGIEFMLPEVALGANVSVGGYLVADSDGSLAAKAAATDYVVFQALSAGTAAGDGYFRAISVCSPVAA